MCVCACCYVVAQKRRVAKFVAHFELNAIIFFVGGAAADVVVVAESSLSAVLCTIAFAQNISRFYLFLK